MDAQLLAFVGVAALLIVTPGPDMALVTRHAIAHGRRSAVLVSMGVCTGILVHGCASALGLSAILLASGAAFTVLKLVGAAYLVLLGIQAFLHARRGFDQFDPGDEAGTSVTGRSAFSQGVLSNLLNPKLAVFFLTLLPQFIEPGGSVLAQSLTLALVFELMTVAWLVGYSIVVARMADVLRRPAIRRRIEQLTGSVLVALGLRLAIERR
jgi:threonine/homoserine/homoserine lactone efflux protein